MSVGGKFHLVLRGGLINRGPDDRDTPVHSGNCDPLPADLENQLRTLDREELQTNLGDYLSAQQIDATLAQGRVLEACVKPR